jgi:DNA-binding transcriptional ArsR family regulator
MSNSSDRPAMTTQRALAHPLRVRIHNELADREASPIELARELDEPLGLISYHVRVLAQAGLLELSRRSFVRGAVQHHYRAKDVGVVTQRLVLPPARADQLVEDVRALLEAARREATEDGAGIELTAVVHRTL